MLGAQRPRICSYPAFVSSAGAEAVELAALAGLVLDEWQRFVLEHALGERADGRWAAPTVGLVVGRQNGKNAILEARELAGLFLLGERLIVHSAHEQSTSSEHFRRLLARIESVAEFERRILKAVHGKGSEAIELRGGQRVLFKTRTGAGGRGFTADLIVYDEAMKLSAADKSAMTPTLAATSMLGNPQTWYAGSAVDQLNPKHDGVELARVRQQGLASAPALAYFEWSAPGDDPARLTDEQMADPESIGLANPGLGIRISMEWVEHERTVELGAREFAVERLGVGDWPDPDLLAAAVITAEAWAALVDAESSLLDPAALAFDVAPDRSSGAIAAAGARTDGLTHGEVVEHRPGTAWLIDRIVEIVDRHDVSGVLCDGAGPAGAFIPELEKRGIEVTAVSAQDHARACGRLVDLVENDQLRHLGSRDVADALRAAKKRPLGDAWAWSRKNSAADITPLVAFTLAAWGSVTAKPKKTAWMVMA